MIADIVVAGAGPGGMAAAIEAARSGASVLVVEARDQIGGNAARSTGYMAFLGSELQREAGVTDSEELFMSDLEKEVASQSERYGIFFDEELTRMVVRGSTDTYRLLRELGVGFNRFIPRPLQHSANRMIDVDDVNRFRTSFEPELARLGIEVMYNTRAERLVVEDGQLAGLAVRPARAGGESPRADEQREVLRAGAVVLATGGYQANHSLRQHYQPAFLANGPYLGLDTCRGDGHLMGQALGGELINMTMIPPLVIVGSALVEDCIAVNLEGRRFHDEAGPYDDRVAALLAQRDKRAYYICDGRTAREKGHLIEQMPGETVSCRTTAELAARIGCPAGELERTIQDWNALVVSGADRDPAFGRIVFPAHRTGLAESPFLAMPMIIGANFPAGGFRVTTSMEVRDVFGDVIPGLFAVGDCVGSINPASGLGGMHILGALTLGRVAGRAAARLVGKSV
jgi:succinate dehydrogenase/fumarate reductase flavoprotein subunit